MFSNPRSSGIGHDLATWPILLLLVLGVLAPAACVLWFMREVMDGQAVFARQQIAEVYRGHLRQMRDDLDSFWQDRASQIREAARDGGAAGFQRIVTGGLADAVVLLDQQGAAVYPSLAATLAVNTHADSAGWTQAQSLERSGDFVRAAEEFATLAVSERIASTAARAAQGQIRCLLRAGRTEVAVAAVEQYFREGPLTSGIDPLGRLIAADEYLLLLDLLDPGDPRYGTAFEKLTNLVNDYSGAPIPSTQRLWLMEELRARQPDLALPTYEAELLANRFLTEDSATTGDGSLRTSRLPGIWKFTTGQVGAVALFREDTMVAAMNDFVGDRSPSDSARFSVVPPNGPLADESVPAGRLLPGWQISYTLVDSTPLEAIARPRRAFYLAIGSLLMGTILLTGIILAQYFRRQVRLARLKTDMVAAVSHELKTPLASMRLLVEALIEDDQLDPGKTRDYLKLIAGENLRLTRLIEHFLTFSRIERNRQAFQFVGTSPAELVDSAAHTFRERYQIGTPQFTVEVAPGLPMVSADRDALVTTLLNLLDNAYKYTPPDKQISLRAFHEGGSVVFAVQDNGIGISANEQKRIFRKFYQVDQSLARETGGCGLGLSIVEFIVRAHGGSVRVTSRPGAGSTFLVSLPDRVPLQETAECTAAAS